MIPGILAISLHISYDPWYSSNKPIRTIYEPRPGLWLLQAVGKYFFRRPFSVQICKKSIIYILKKQRTKKRSSPTFLGLYNTTFVGPKPSQALGICLLCLMDNPGMYEPLYSGNKSIKAISLLKLMESIELNQSQCNI